MGLNKAYASNLRKKLFKNDHPNLGIISGQ